MGDRKRCWDCIRRRLVCDSGRPSCNRCQTAQIECSGYGEKKPVKFLEPGVVLSRPRKKKQCANGNRRSNGDPAANTSQTTLQEKEPNECLAVDVKHDPQMHVSGKSLSTSRSRQTPGIAYEKLRTDSDDIIEAVTYWDDNAQPWFATSPFRGNPFAAPIAGRADLIPAPTRHTLTVLALSHRIHKISVHSCHEDTKALSLRRHEHMDHAITLLRERIAAGLSADSLGTITSIMTFNKIELMYSDLVDWRGHIGAFWHLINLAGGLQKLYKKDARFRIPILTIMLTNIVANTTSPATDQYMTEYYIEHLPWVSEVYSICDYPPFPCPRQLFLLIVRINYLRSMTQSSADASAVIIVLNEITNFSPEHWACSKSKENYDFWLALARIYQSAVMLYATSAVTFSSAALKLKIELHLRRLLELLDIASESSLSIPSIIWPTVVAGAKLDHDATAGRCMVRRCLVRLSEEENYSLPLRALDVLEKYWITGRTMWDDVFDTPSMFVL